MRAIKLLFLSLLIFPVFAQTLQADEVRAVDHYNLEGNRGIKGFDPVSYFPEGGDHPEPGRIGIRLEYKGVVYTFKNQENKETFLQDPKRYEPTYGGWCAWAMRRGAKVDIDPELYTLAGNRLHLFVSPSTKAKFDADIASVEAKADRHWKDITGEEPRL